MVSVQSKMPKIIFNFTIRNLYNSPPTRNVMKKWHFTQSSDCSFCHIPETLLHVVAGYKLYLEKGRYNWRHNAALLALANFFIAHSGSPLYIDLPCLYSPSIITGDFSGLILFLLRPISRFTFSNLQLALRIN